jgi:thymidine kinase
MGLSSESLLATFQTSYRWYAHSQRSLMTLKADSIEKLNAVCMGCGKDAPFSYRLTSDTEVEVIGGAEKYMAVCRTCYLNKQKILY